MKSSCIIWSYTEENILFGDILRKTLQKLILKTMKLFTGHWANTSLLLQKNTFLARKICPSYFGSETCGNIELLSQNKPDGCQTPDKWNLLEKQLTLL